MGMADNPINDEQVTQQQGVVRAPGAGEGEGAAAASGAAVEDRRAGKEDHYEWDTGEPRDPEDGMPFLEHLEEFRWTVGRSILAFLVGVMIVGFLMPHVGAFLQLPLIKAYGSAEMVGEKLITYKPMGVFSVFIQVALLGGLVLSMPFVLYFLACFIAPGLTERERKVVRPACAAAFLVVVAGVAVAFY
jgi:Sec-independent protein secretion pathway component TatC